MVFEVNFKITNVSQFGLIFYGSVLCHIGKSSSSSFFRFPTKIFEFPTLILEIKRKYIY